MNDQEKKEMWKQMLDDHARWKIEWIKSESKISYYEWLLNRVENALTSRIEKEIAAE